VWADVHVEHGQHAVFSLWAVFAALVEGNGQDAGGVGVADERMAHGIEGRLTHHLGEERAEGPVVLVALRDHHHAALDVGMWDDARVEARVLDEVEVDVAAVLAGDAAD